MKYKIKTDLWVKFILWGCILMFVPVFFFVEPDELWILVLSTLIMAVIILPLFRSYYELGEEEIIIHMYGFKKRIKYSNIKAIRKCENWYSSAAMSRERVEIRQHNKSKLTGTLYISPERREEFFIDLKHLCHHLEDDINKSIVWDE